MSPDLRATRGRARRRPPVVRGPSRSSLEDTLAACLDQDRTVPVFERESHLYPLEVVTCAKCGGAGRVDGARPLSRKCQACAGAGHKDRRERDWRFDFAWPGHRLLVEVDGGTYGKGVECHRCGSAVMRRLKDGRWMPVSEATGHGSHGGSKRDREKDRHATVLGYRVLRFTRDEINDDTAREWIKRALKISPG